MILAGDIGGTNSRLFLADNSNGKIEVLQQQSYPSQDFPDLIPIVENFLQTQAGASKIDAACFAVAGPVKGDTAKITNLPWHLDARVLAEQLHVPQVRLINDFAGVAWGVGQLGREELLPLNEAAADPDAPRVVLGAGTGLGAAALVTCNGQISVIATEAGHMDFPPRNEDEVALLRFWQQRLPRVSYESFLSGSGLRRLYQFNAIHYAGRAEQADWPDPAEISAAGLQATDETAVRALTQFIRIYAACASNLALAYKATGGVYIAGGIAPRLADLIARSDFMQVFTDKAPMTALLQAMPVKLVLNTDVGLLGAAAVAIGSHGG